MRIDEYSGIIFATAQTGEKAPNDISHCLQLFVAWRMPRQIKTDNGPAFTSSQFKTFCTHWEIAHHRGIPHNSHGQGIIERTHQTLKAQLLK